MAEQVILNQGLTVSHPSLHHSGCLVTSRAGQQLYSRSIPCLGGTVNDACQSWVHIMLKQMHWLAAGFQAQFKTLAFAFQTQHCPRPELSQGSSNSHWYLLELFSLASEPLHCDLQPKDSFGIHKGNPFLTAAFQL